MNSKWQNFAVAALIVMPSALLGAAEPAPAEGDGTGIQEPVYEVSDSNEVFSNSGSQYSNGVVPQLVARFGWWGISTDGSNNKIGEYQSLESSPFLDVDGLTSDGRTTLDFHVTSTDEETTDVGFRYIRPGLSSKFRYQRFLHRLDHDPLTGMGTPGDAPYIGPIVDFNAGEDYAIRVNTLNARFKGDITENVKWRLNLFGMRKFGERQGRALNHNCSDHECHIQAGRQTIDWLTMEIEPVVEAKLSENATLTYSRTMRTFEQSDGVLTRAYPNHPTRFVDGASQQPYAVVPENYTQIDRLKLRSKLGEDTQLYAMGYIGDTENQARNTHREFHGFDVRVTNTSMERMTLTGYAKYYESNNEKPGSNPEINEFNAGTFNPDPVTGYDPTRSYDPRHPVDRRRFTAGAKSRWRPFDRDHALGKLSFGSRYEYQELERDHVTYDWTASGSSFTGPTDIFTQPTTVSNSLYVDTKLDVNSSVRTFARYTLRNNNNPLFGMRENTETDAGADLTFAINTSQPEWENLVELGGTWTPNDILLVDATVGMLTRDHDSEYANFSEDDYPITVSAACTPTDRWSVHGGFAFFSNWIDQTNTIGIDHGGRGSVDLAENVPFAYGGTANVINIGTTYALGDRLTLSGLFEFSRSKNRFQDPTVPGQDLSLLPSLSDVLIETSRLNVGVDYLLTEAASIYCRYNFYDWNDKSGAQGSGTANMLLGGVAATY